MKKITLLTWLVLLCSYSYCQSYKKRTPEEKAHYYTDEMVKELTLDSVTAVKVYDINLKVSQQFDSLYATKPEKEDARKGAIEIYKQRNIALKGVLSKQQFLMFDDIQREKREKKKLEKEKSKE